MVNTVILLPDSIKNIAIEFCDNICLWQTHFDYSLRLVASILLKDKLDHKKFLIAENGILYDLLIEKDDKDIPFDETWKELKDVRLLAKQNKLDNIRFYINESKKKSVVTGVKTCSEYHFICAVFTRLAPWYFNEPVTEKEIDLLHSFMCNDSSNTVMWFIKYFSGPEFKKAQLDKYIKNINDVICKSAISTAQESVEIARSTMRSAESAYVEACNRWREANIMLNGLMMNGDLDKQKELHDYLCNNTGIEVLATDSCGFDIIAKGYLTNVDVDILEEYAANERSFLYIGRIAQPCFDSKENKKKLLLALFSSIAKYKVKVAGEYYLTTRKVEVYTRHKINDTVADHENFIVNPHIYYFACLGEYRPLITNALRDNDVIQAMDLCIASVSSMNIAESATVTKFLDELYTTSKKCIVDEYGNSMTPEEALRKIESEESESNG